MKKIYLDWNIINHLEENSELYDYIRQYQSHFVFVYSPAHFSDLMKSYKESGGNTYFEKDLKRLESICETHLMYYSDKKMSICNCPPTEFLEKEGKYYPTIKDVFSPDYFKKALHVNGVDLYNLFSNGLKSISLGKTIELPFIGGFSNGLELLNCALSFFEKILMDKVYVKNFRTITSNNLTDKEITKINGCAPDKIIETINAYLFEHGCEDDFTKLVKKALLENSQDDEKLIFESLYVGLDFMRFHSDQRDLMNILTDADHAYYGSFCDVIVTEDAKMRLKADAVFSNLNISTRIICEKDFLQFLKDEVSGEVMIEDPIKEVLSNQHIPESYDADTCYGKWKKLDFHYLGYFNKLEFQLIVSTGRHLFVFSKERKLEKCVYYSETDKFFAIMKDLLHEPCAIKLFETEYVEKYKLKDKNASFCFYFTSQIQMILSVEEDNDGLFPILYMVLPISDDYTSQNGIDNCFD